MTPMGTRRLTIGLMITVAVLAFEALAVAAIGPRVARDLGGESLYGWLFSAFMLANMVGIVLAGHSTDRRGPGPVYVVGLALFGAGLLLGGLAPSMAVLVVARAVQGLGGGALYNAAYVTIGRSFGEAERPRQFALLSSAWVIPGLISPAIGGLAAEAFGWRSVFLGLIVLVPVAAALALPPMWPLGPGDDGDPARGAPIRPAFALAIGAALLIAGLGAHRIVILVPAVVVGLALAVPHFRRLTPAGTLRAARGLPAAVAFRGLTTCAFFGADAFLAFALANERGFSPVAVGLVLTPSTVLWAVGSWGQARLAGRWSRRNLATAGMACIVAAIALGGLVVVPGVPVGVMVVAWALGGLGMGLSYSPTSMVALTEAEPGRQGAATSAVQLTDVLGGALGAGIGGAIVAGRGALGLDRSAAIGVVFVVATLEAVLAVWVSRRFPDDPPDLLDVRTGRDTTEQTPS